MAFCFNFPDPIDEAIRPDSLKDDRSSDPNRSAACDAAEHNSYSFAAYIAHSFFICDDCTKTETAINGNPPLRPDIVWNAVTTGDTTLQFVCPQWLESQMACQTTKSDALASAFGGPTHLDIVPQIYEGGFRVWDGACDMLSYLSTEIKRDDFKKKRVLELGCGAGLPGIFALLNGATVHFHDYNSEVIEFATVPNIRRNLDLSGIPSAESADRVRLFSGDWNEFHKHCSVALENPKYDLILTSDTVYRRDVMEKLCTILPKLLRDNGEAFVAGKSHYFGLDGGTDAFRDEIKKQGLLTVKASKDYPDSLRREILTLSWVK